MSFRKEGKVLDKVFTVEHTLSMFLFFKGEMESENHQESLVKNEILPPDESELLEATSEDFPTVNLSDNLPMSLTESLPSNMTESFPDMLTQVMYEQGVLSKSSPNKVNKIV